MMTKKTRGSHATVKGDINQPNTCFLPTENLNSSSKYALLKMFAVCTKGIIKTDSEITLFGQTLPLATVET